ncbi:CorA family divalent cation transporter [Thalassobaculum sp.]|uniref:CorA family divalent cation transporter n=1 Tax=Thalassobaculum sp. TaxID=2022740 RepID=UPI0032ECEC20
MGMVTDCTAYLAIPLRLGRSDQDRLSRSIKWVRWPVTMSVRDERDWQANIDDIRNFLIASLRDELCGSEAGARKWGRLSATTDFPRLDLRPDYETWATIVAADLVLLPRFSILLLKAELHGCFSAQDVGAMLGKICALEPTHSSAKVPLWTLADRQTRLIDWVHDDLLDLEESRRHQVARETRWFGAHAPMMIVAHADTDPTSFDENSKISLGILFGRSIDDRFSGPTESELRAIRNAGYREWSNWSVHTNGTRSVVLINGAGLHGQPENAHNLYSLLFILTIYQNVRLLEYLDMTSDTAIELRDVRRGFDRFRRKFLPLKATTFPTGGRLYQRWRELAELPRIQRDIEDEIQKAEELERADNEHYEAKVLLALTILAAIFLPATLITGFFGMNIGDMQTWGDPWAWFTHSLVLGFMGSLTLLAGLLALLLRTRIETTIRRLLEPKRSQNE